MGLIQKMNEARTRSKTEKKREGSSDDKSNSATLDVSREYHKNTIEDDVD